ncbi:hypothetical protein A4X13_0g3490 [Tilletia indica]|uniref:Uncharacterized protein n=1 Tax=Tilletia indica TaxID=43049 RepID=A0A177TAV8_9BASI|nr:hypothetical protein A4X13_0g3490 [Tilletia indica]
MPSAAAALRAVDVRTSASWRVTSRSQRTRNQARSSPSSNTSSRPPSTATATATTADRVLQASSQGQPRKRRSGRTSAVGEAHLVTKNNEPPPSNTASSSSIAQPTTTTPSSSSTSPFSLSSCSTSPSGDSARAESREAQTLASEPTISAASAATAAAQAAENSRSSSSSSSPSSQQLRKQQQQQQTLAAATSSGRDTEAGEDSIDEHSAVISSLLVSSLLMGCSSLLCAVSALVRLPSSLPDSWQHAWETFWTEHLPALGLSVSGASHSSEQRQHALWQAGHSLVSLHALFAENRLALFILLTLSGILCTLIAQSGSRLRRPNHATIPLNANNQHGPTTRSPEKSRFESVRGRSAFSLRSGGLDSPRASRPQSRAQSPSSSVTSAPESASRIHRLAAGLAGSAGSKQRNSIIRTGSGTTEDQQHSNQSLSFADRIVVKFRTLPRTESEDGSTAASGKEPVPKEPSRPSAHAQQATKHQQPQHQSRNPEPIPTSPGKVFHPNQLFDPTTDEERALRKIYDDLVASRTAESDLSDQLASQSAQSSSARASLEASLETLRTRRKADDAERAALRARVKVLDEERRLAEGKKREAERRLDGWKAKVGALEREWDEGIRALSSAKDLRKSLRDEWKRREEEIGKRRIEVEREVEELQRLWEANDGGAGSQSVQNSTQKAAKDGSSAKSNVSNASATSPAPSSPTTDSKPSVAANRDHNNAKVVRDRIKTLEGQIKKERERLERIKRSAQQAAASAPASKGVENHSHEVGGKGRHGHVGHPHHQNFGWHSGSVRGGSGGGGGSGVVGGGSSSSASANPIANATSSPSHSSTALHQHPSSPIIALASSSTQDHTGPTQTAPPTSLFNFDPMMTHPFGNSTQLPPFLPPSSSHMLANVFDPPSALRPSGPFDSVHTSPLHRHADMGSGSIRAGEGLLPMHMNYAGVGGGPTGSAALNEGSHHHNPELHLPAWVRSSVLGSHFDGSNSSHLESERAPIGAGANGLELPSFVPRSNPTSSSGVIHQQKNGSAVLSGSPLAGKSSLSTQHNLPHLPWDWPAFRSIAPLGSNGDSAGLGSSESATTTGTGNRFGSHDGLVLPLHSRANLSIPAGSGSISLSSPLSSTQNALPLPNLLPPSIAVTTPMNMTTPQMDNSTSMNGNSIFGLTATPNPSPSSLKARPRTGANRSRRARSPVSPYSAGLLPRNLLSYADDDDDDEAALNEMESAWASLEEEVDDEES